MKRAARDYNLPGNPVKQVDKPSQRREREPVLVTVDQVEAMRAWFLARDDLPRRDADRAARLRRPAPGIRGAAAALDRRARAHDPLPSDQARRARRTRDAAARPAGRATCAPGAPPAEARPTTSPVIPNRDGRAWREHDWDNWRARAFRAAAAAAGLPAAKDDGPRARAPARSALELRDAADLRGPAAAVRRRTARPQRRHPPARLRPRLAGVRPGAPRQRGGPDPPRATPTRATAPGSPQRARRTAVAPEPVLADSASGR